MTPEMMKNNQELAAQAALRAQQIMFRKSIGSTVSAESSPSASPSKKSIPPVVPARGDSVLSKQPPEIPPKRHSLKKLDDHGNASAPSKQQMAPPPLPQKPSTHLQYGGPRLPGNVIGASASLPGSPVPPMKNAAAVIMAPTVVPSQNPFLSNSPPLQKRPSQPSAQSAFGMPNSMPNAQKISQKTLPHDMSKRNCHVNQHVNPVSPIDDFSSEDALRGIESGLRNMERAMQEQMNIRSAAAAVQHQQQHPKPSDKMNFNPIRSMERGFSMDQMRLDAMNLGSMRSTLEEMKSKGFVDMNAMGAPNAPNAPNARPIENHMKSLDRNLPLELQYSRHHHHRSQSQQEMVEQMRHNLTNAAAATGAATMLSNARQSGAAIARDDVRLRRRSSHDENQMSQSQTNAAGKISNRSDSRSNSSVFPFLFI